VSTPASGLARALAALSGAGVAYVVVGVGGINFYARTPAEAYATLDLVALIEPTVQNLRTALGVLAALGYRFEAAGEPFLDLGDAATLSGVVRNGATLSARHPVDGEIDVLLSIAGYSYRELVEDAAVFRVAQADVRVPTLEKLLRAKQASGRHKDLAFRKAFEARVLDETEEP
jgi:hypothetical protein